MMTKEETLKKKKMTGFDCGIFMGKEDTPNSKLPT